MAAHQTVPSNGLCEVSWRGWHFWPDLKAFCLPSPRLALVCCRLACSDILHFLILWSGRRDSNPRRPAWGRVGWTCLQQLSVSGALYRLTASLAKSAFSSLTPSNRGFFEVQCTVIRTSICAAFHGLHSRTVSGPDDNHGSPFCLVHFLLRQIAAARPGWRPLPRYFNSNTPTSLSPSRSWSALAVLK